MSDSAINVGVVGVGYLGKFHAEKYAASAKANLVAVVDTDEARAKEIGASVGVDSATDYRGLFGRVKCVSIAVPTRFHYQVARDFIDVGIDVLVEKPLTAEIDEARELVAAAQQKNVILQVGHNTLRLMTAEMENRALTAAELQTMERLLGEALAAGAWGLSSGLFTAPGSYADAEEIHALARVLRRHGATYSSHIRDEANSVHEAVREAIAVAEATGVHVQIAHLKLSGTDNWGGAVGLLEEIAAARRRGVPVDCDAYPYDAASNPLRNLFPRWVMDGGIGVMMERLRRPEVRARLRGEIAHEGLNNFGRIPSWDAVRVAVAPRLPEEAGNTFGQIAQRRGVDPFDAVCDFVIADRGETRILVTSMSDKDVHAISSTPWVTVGSDANSLATSGVTSQGKPHPRSYGTHARLLGPFVRDLRLLTLSATVHKTTGAAAAALGLTDRGVLREGAWADVVVFDPDRIADRATYDEPHRYAVGVSSVVVNGEVVVDAGDHTGALPGRVLRRS